MRQHPSHPRYSPVRPIEALAGAIQPMASFYRPTIASRSVWDLSICLDCHLRQIRRLNTASRMRLSGAGARSLKSTVAPHIRRTYATRLPEHSLATSRLDGPPPYSSTSSPRRLSTSSQPRSQGMNTSWDRGPTFPPPDKPRFKIRKGANIQFDAPPGSNNVRNKLNEWKPSPDQMIPQLFSESNQPKAPGEVSNDLTRPEDLTLSMSGEVEGLDDFTFDEDFGDFMSDFDRLSSIAGINDTSIDNTLMSIGDLVHLASSSQGTPLLGCFLGVSLERKFVFYTSLGGIYISSSRSHEFQVRNFFSAEEVAPLLPFVDEAIDLQGPNVMKEQQQFVPRNLGGQIIRKMNAFRTEVDQYLRQYSGALDRAFETVAHPTEVTFRTLEDIIAVVTRLPQPTEGNYPDALQFAISNSLKSEKFGFSFEKRLYSYNKVFIVLAKNNMSSVTKVQGWLRSYWEEASRVAAGTPVPALVAEGAAIVRKFQKKTKRIVEESRLYRRSISYMYPLSCNQGENPKDGENMIYPAVSWSETDRDFIKTLFMQTSADTLKNNANFRSIPASLIKASNAFTNIAEKSLHIGTSWSFLIEIGAVQPFTDGKAFDMHVRPANMALNMSLNKIGARILAGESLLQAGRLRDSMTGVRKDWGNLPCFCIDKASTVEVDDGISLESVPGEPGNYWFHTHIVHLSAFVPPTHPIGQCAEHRLSTVYNEAAGTMTMLPPWVGKDFSLGNNKPCITFSAKFNSNGDILDQKIQPGFLRNVVRMTPESVDKAFGKEGAHSSKVLHSLSVGPHISEEGNQEPEAPPHEITPEEKETLATMLDIMKKYETKRNGIKYWAMSNKLDLIVQNVKSWPFGVSSPDTWRSEFCLTDPSIKINMLDEVEGNYEGIELPSHTIVEQAMLLAGAIGAKFGAERNIPLVYTGTRSPVNGLESATKLLKDLMEQGRVDRNIWREVVSLYATASRTSHPVPQRFLGLDEYARITSPLRRHFDLLNLWQIDAALLEEHRRKTGKMDDSSSDEVPTTSAAPAIVNNTASNHLTSTFSTNPIAPWLPYTRPQLDRLMRICTTRSMTLQWYQNNNRNHWKLLALARAFHLNEAPLPPRLTALVGKQGKDLQFKARLMEFEMGSRFLNRPGEAEHVPGGEKTRMPTEGEVWEVRVEDVEVYMRQVVVAPVRRLAGSMREWEAVLKKERADAEKDGGLHVEGEVEKRMEPLMDEEARLAPA